jgi:hypothetical protein
VLNYSIINRVEKENNKKIVVFMSYSMYFYSFMDFYLVNLLKSFEVDF